jgi:DNA processing protein
MAGKVGLELARQGALLVSGIAQGLDAAAIRGALKGGGPVVSVLGGGVDVVYPRENRFLYEDVAAAGALISEYPPGTGIQAGHFPVRNRIISGLSLAVVAVECRWKSGTMRTVERALDQDRDVFAVPGPADGPMSEGTNLLIQRGRSGAVRLGCAPGVCRALSRQAPQSGAPASCGRGGPAGNAGREKNRDKNL